MCVTVYRRVVVFNLLFPSCCLFCWPLDRVFWGELEMAPWGWQTCDDSAVGRNRPTPRDCLAIMEDWRQTLAVGDHVNAEDSHHKWYEASVISADEDTVGIRFLGWSPKSQPNKYDEIVQRDSRRLLPFTSKIRDWRRIQVGDEVCVHACVWGGANYVGRVLLRAW